MTTTPSKRDDVKGPMSNKRDWIFVWEDGRSKNKLELHDKTQEEALKEAEYFGYKETRWFNCLWTDSHHYSVTPFDSGKYRSW